MISKEEDITKLMEDSSIILVIQADNPDGDSLGSALALEEILSELGKTVHLYCGVNIPTYLHYLSGWDRVESELPNKFDLSIIVDNSSMSLLESLSKNSRKSVLASKPCVVIDHHAVEPDINFASIVYNQPTVSTTEAIYMLAKNLNWPLNGSSAMFLAAGIMSDSLGLSSDNVTDKSVRVLADLIKLGANLSKIEQGRRKLMQKSPELLSYKGLLLQRTEYYADNQIAIISIPWEEITKYSHAYNPPMLVIDDIRLVEGVKIVIAFKIYQDGKVTVKIRCNSGWPIAAKLAETFGGGGHDYASGFKITDGRTYNDIKKATITKTQELLNAIV